MNPRRPETALPHPLIPPAAYDELCDFLRASSALTPAAALQKCQICSRLPVL